MARSLFLSPPPLPLAFHKPRRTPPLPLPQRWLPIQLTAQVSQNPPPPPPAPPTEQPTPPHGKKSFSVAVGEVFLGIISLLMNRGRHRRTGRRRRPDDGSGGILFGDEYDDEDEADGGGGAVQGGVGGNEVVVWEQRQVDVEAERRRKVVTSPGFSFSAAGLLFPYHLGVADFLLKNGYIKVFFIFVVVTNRSSRMILYFQNDRIFYGLRWKSASSSKQLNHVDCLNGGLRKMRGLTSVIVSGEGGVYLVVWEGVYCEAGIKEK